MNSRENLRVCCNPLKNIKCASVSRVRMWGSSDLLVFEQILKNPGASTTLNGWLEAQLQKQFEPNFKGVDDRLTEFDGRFKEIEARLNTEREFIEHLKLQIQSLEEKNRCLEEKNRSLQEYLLEHHH